MSRPTHCPHCGASTTAHTGPYCQECGESLVPATSSQRTIGTPEQRDRILYEAEEITPGRGQLYREVWEGGERIVREPVGTPAPIATVRKAEQTIDLGPAR